MTDDRDPILQELFANADENLTDEAFTSQVMAQTDGLRRKRVIGRVCLGLALLSCAWLLAGPAQDAVQLLTQGLTLSLFKLENPALAQLLSPVNNITGLLAVSLAGLMLVWRKIFS